ncbi:formimidoylglutamase [Aquimarina sp. MMG016]|uniref:formimidoylglutamase n=1 Tax=Aquimarina sp. MMG016 TaxID=2822690 RepID=UPI001B3A3F2C|nr:formimidoylglutamase [Aquimarina sp. MMG016]MBQ4822562.1 formimidoylglutamase [Aquimarina sp. MMG016]
MANYQKPNAAIWTGHQSDSQLYFHEKIKCIDLENDILPKDKKKRFGLLGYACDEGVKRNLGRVGTAEGPNSIRRMLTPLSNHLKNDIEIIDFGDITSVTSDLELTQSITLDKISYLSGNKIFNIILGGGHDLGFAHFNGLQKVYPNQTIGIINLDAHFDLREVEKEPNSGTPFYQIAEQQNDRFKYLCLGIQKVSNNKKLYETAKKLGVQFIENTEFKLQNFTSISNQIQSFINTVDLIYLTIDMDGFSSAYAPGVSAPSPLGFNPDIAIKTIKLICESNKLISADIVELNPKYDIDNCTARLAARLVYFLIEELS